MANPNPNLTRKTLVVCRTEANYGTDAFGGTPATSGVGSGAYLLWDEINPLQLDTQIVEQQSVRASYSKNQDLVGRQLWMLRPKTHLMSSPGADPAVAGTDPGALGGGSGGTGLNTGGSPTAGVPPFFSHLLKACAMSQTVAASTSVRYKPVSSGFSSASAYVWADSHRILVAGLYGNVIFEARAGEAFTLDFDMKGNYAEPEHSPIPSATYPVDNKVLVQNEALTITPAGGAAYTPIIRSFRFDVGNQIIERRDMNSSRGLYGLFISDRRPTLEVVIEVDTISNFNIFQDYAHETTGATTLHSLSFVHGGTGSNANEAKFTFPSCQLANIQYQDDQGIRTYALTYNVVSTIDDDDFSIQMSGDQS